MTHRYLLPAIALLVSIAGRAQNPIETTFTVDYKTEAGTDTTVQLQTVNSNTLRFIGGKATVYNPITGQTTQQGNQDLQSWIEDLNYQSVTLKALPASDLPVDIPFGCGFCLAKHPEPTLEDSVIACVSDGTAFYAQLDGLDYTATYYMRPYIWSGRMYGGEVSFTMPRTIEGALQNEADLKGVHYHDAETGVVLNGDALKQFAAANSLLDETTVVYALEYFLTNGRLAQLKAQAYRTVDCTDGTLSVVGDVPASIVQDFAADLEKEVAFSPATLNQEVKTGNSYLTRNLGSTKVYSCDPAWGVPYNSYVEFLPASANTNPNLAFDIPKYLLPQTYALSIVFVIPDLENDPRPYYFRARIFEQEDDGTYSIGTYLTNTDNTMNFLSNPVRCDTVSLGYYTFKGNPHPILLLMTNISSRMTSQYNRAMRIAQIRLVPVKEEEGE